jgi:hypothetical protein
MIMDARLARAAHVMIMVMRHSTAARFTITIEPWKVEVYMEDAMAEYQRLTYMITMGDNRFISKRK